MEKLKSIGVVLFLSALAITLFTSCDRIDNEKTQDMYNAEQEHAVANQQRLYKVQPPVHIDWSCERENINKRTIRWNDKNKVSYIYLVNYGKVMAFYTVKGKISSVDSHITNTEQIIKEYTASSGRIHDVIPSPAEDGSYGTNGDGIFFFTTDDTYVEWRGDYMLCDKPLKLATAPELVRILDK